MFQQEAQPLTWLLTRLFFVSVQPQMDRGGQHHSWPAEKGCCHQPVQVQLRLASSEPAELQQIGEQQAAPLSAWQRGWYGIPAERG